MSAPESHSKPGRTIATEPPNAFDGESDLLTRRTVNSILVTIVLHAIALILLASIALPTNLSEEVFSLLVPAGADEPELEPSVDVVVQPEELIDGITDDAAASVDSTNIAELPTPVIADFDDQKIAAAMSLAEAESIVTTLRGDFGGRSEKGKLAAIRKFGGTANSERAVQLGLRWLASIQAKDGSWDFAEVGNVGGAGTLQNGQMGATGMALLCYLGAGHTHTSNTEYATNVASGLKYLIKNTKVISKEADLRGGATGNGGMYIQGIATIALCEAHALTRRRHEDKNLKATAQAAMRFIEAAQDKGGGWRYQPRTPGDTSVVGWQVMALKSGQAAKLRVDRDTFSKVHRFLNSVQTNNGANYGYTGQQPNRPGTTAIGLLCRMYMGWKRDRKGMPQGIAFLSKRGPARDDSYYNYYASQVLHHWGGAEWKRWNDQLRPQLVEAQVRTGPATGSWNPVDRHAGQGGRIYETALSIMTLEVYYRHLPLYRRIATSAR
jgi:hypothetical protein